MKVVFSGVQPTGKLHLGNYLGAIKPWRGMIKSEQNSQFFFSIVDMHAITILQNPVELCNAVLETLAIYLASGIKPSKNVRVFQQSNIKEHAELSWILSCNTPMGWLDRMTQYKDKTKQNKERQCLGLYAYPCLMASDILLYNTNEVPAGDDQKQHLELTRDIAIRMNDLYKEKIFTVPAIKISQAKRIMSLKDATFKMSKSDTFEISRINLTDTADEIYSKIKKATTGDVNSKEVQNLQLIYKELTGKEYVFESTPRFTQFKIELAECLIHEFVPISKEFNNLMNNKDELLKILKEEALLVREVASKKMEQVKSIIGF